MGDKFYQKSVKRSDEAKINENNFESTFPSVGSFKTNSHSERFAC